MSATTHTTGVYPHGRRQYGPSSTYAGRQRLAGVRADWAMLSQADKWKRAAKG